MHHSLRKDPLPTDETLLQRAFADGNDKADTGFGGSGQGRPSSDWVSKCLREGDAVWGWRAQNLTSEQ